METLKVCITPLSPFGTLPKGDTLFGHLCWAVRNRLGEERLKGLLEGYTTGRPFAVVSDALPAGFLPRPALPSLMFTALADSDRKEAKRRAWMPAEKFGKPVTEWLTHCKKPGDVFGGSPLSRPQPHNSISRESGTTGERFSPYSMTQHWYGHRDEKRQVPIESRLDIYAVLDDARLNTEEVSKLLDDIGTSGFGRDASIGLGKFSIHSTEAICLPEQEGSSGWLTLAPCAPQGQGFDPDRCFYQVFTRFGRHGDAAAITGKPFKTPVLLAQTGAVLTPRRYEARSFIGSGLGGDGSLSQAIPATVHQGYAPVVGIRVPECGEVAE
jgi:CRISPR-associated protein Csm4